jgi:hypothetical protein
VKVVFLVLSMKKNTRKQLILNVPLFKSLIIMYALNKNILIFTLLLSGHLAQNDYGSSTIGLADLEKLDEIDASHYTLDKLET